MLNHWGAFCMNNLGIGISLRRKHYDEIFESEQPFDWLEIISENFMRFGGHPRNVLDKAKEKWSIVPHGISLAIGSVDPLNLDYLTKLKALTKRINSPWFSDHLCFSSAFGHYYHDLLPLIRTKESLNHLIPRIREVQDRIELPFALENISFYYESPDSKIPEHEFLNELLDKTGANLLLDVNNVYVNSLNHKFDPDEFIKKLNLDRVVQIHLAGHDDSGDIVIDTHGAEVCDPVWNLYERTLRLLGRPVSTLIEWDNNVPELDCLNAEVVRAKSIIQKVFK